MATLDNLAIEISANTRDAASKIQNLATALSALKRASSIKGDNLEKVADGFSAIKRSIVGIRNDSITKVERLADALEKISKANVGNVSRAFSNVKKSTKKAADTFKAPAVISNGTVGFVDGGMTSHESYEGAWREIGEAEQKARSVAETNKALAKFRQEWQMLNTATRYAKSFFKTVFPGFNMLGNVLKKIIAPLKGFIRSIGRIALYRAIRSAIKAISAGIKEGVQNLAMFSKLRDEMDTHQANKVMSLYASNFLYLKNAIATAVIPILKTLEPIIDAVTKKTVQLVNTLAQLFSLISGSSTWTRAKYYYIDYADSLDKASGSASKLNKQLAAFDELNNLTTSGGSGSGNDLNYLEMFEDPIPLDSWIANLKGKSWKEIGSTITEKLKEALDNINWTSIKQKVGEVGTKIAEFFNGLFSPDTFRSLGRTIAEGLNTVLTFFFNLGKEFDAYQAGQGVSGGFAEFFSTFDFGLLADTLNVWVDNLFDAIKGVVDGWTKDDWKKVFSSMFEFFKKIDVDTVALGIGVITVVTVGRVAKWVFTSGVLSFLGLSLGQALIKNGVTISLSGVGVKLAGVASVGAEIGAILVGAISGYLIANGIAQIFSAVTGDQAMLEELQKWNPFTNGKLGDVMLGWFEAWVQSMSKTPLTMIAKAIVDGITKGVTLVSESVIRKGLMPFFINFFSGICAIFGISSPAKEMYPVGKNIVLGIIEGIKQVPFFSKLNEWYNESVKPFFAESKWKTLGTSVKDSLSTTLSYSNMWKIGNQLGKGLYDAAKSMFDELLSAYKTLKANIENNPIIQVIKTETGSYSGGSTSEWKEYKDTSGDTNIPGSTKNPTTTKERVKKPSYAGVPEPQRSQLISAWESAHPKNKYEWYAKGGFPTVGSLFWAGESGAELVGNINGRTGVANTDQIETAMYHATYDAMTKALSENGMNVTIEGDVDNLFRVMQRKSSDFYTRTGRAAF